LAARGLPPSCEGLDDRIGDAVFGHTIRGFERFLPGL